MANSVCEIRLTTAELKLGEDIPSFSGAVVDFWGLVRPLEANRQIEGIDYEAHTTMADHQLQLVARQAAEKFELHSIVIHHRVGFVRVKEASVFVRVTSQHRTQAFQANQWIMDELKRKVPIWKRPRFKFQDDLAGDTLEKDVVSQ
ncbi:MAG: moaE [Spartobacteria bacterium]|nr:moaE [Spartobacteria bacterium]